ncbi:hypothetical protein PUATCC27989T_03405 [Phytobacter ursingii]|nr:hypothetical protein PUATCC27989T_03405 [Phytobacter ursingii]
MSNSRGSSRGTSEKKENCVKEFVVSDNFKIMMEESLPAARAVLEKRKKDLNNWGRHHEEFERIFGVSGNNEIEHFFTVYDTKSGNSVRESELTTVKEFMRKSIDRMIVICNSLYVDKQREIVVDVYGDKGNKNKEILYACGSFINKTDDDEFSAFVLNDQTWRKTVEEYRSTLKINIGQRFICKKIMGRDSKASTLCHEISHFNRFGFFSDEVKGSMGGVGTRDLPDDKDYKGTKVYISHANDLVKNHDINVFKSAYNFERYFEIVV